ncbi:hypothetical protein F4604DRAFT_1950186 [Suillus subluteus]|nr:hypothetical protein F4604DRAFT_1950186 [Suillus subluteus]
MKTYSSSSTHMLKLFSTNRLANETGLRAALCHLDALGGYNGLQPTIEHLLSLPHVFAYIVSVWDRSAEMISQIMVDFPTDAQEYCSSLTRKMLDNVSVHALALPIESLAREVAKDIGRYRAFIEDALPVLCALSTMKFADVESLESDLNLFGIGPNDRFVNIQASRAIRKRDRQNACVTIDASLFVKLGMAVPPTSEAATSLSTYILAELKNILSVCILIMYFSTLPDSSPKFYLSLLRRTELVGDIKALLFPNVEESAKDVAPEVSFPEDTESSTEQSAYPMVQPMKAALYFDNANGFGEWRILISTEAYKHLRQHRRADQKIFKIIYKKIKHLSHGQFSTDNHMRLNGPDAGIPIFEVKMTKDLRLVYQIDCVPDQNGVFERQGAPSRITDDHQSSSSLTRIPVIKVYGIYRHSELGRIWNALGNHLARRGAEYRRRCIFRTKPADNMILPASFPPTEPEPEILASPLDLSAKDMEHLQSLLVLEKYVTFSQAFLHSLVADQDVHHVFILSPQEQKVVESTTSCYVLGRSGTGKTTTMLFKILGIQRAWELSAVDMPKPRQIFVTKSRMLATKVEEYFTRLLESLAMAGYTLQEIAKLKAQRVEDDLIDLDDAPESQMNVPARYSQLEDKHFPLFVTFDRLAKMIAADIFNMDDPETRRSAELFFNTNDAEAHDSFVTFAVFEKQYWPHFPLTKNLSNTASFLSGDTLTCPTQIHGWFSASLWASQSPYPTEQFLNHLAGIIKGSEQALAFPDGFLDRPSYLRLSCRSYPIFANQRDTLYDMFEIYRKFKKQKRQFDVADRYGSFFLDSLDPKLIPNSTHAILKILIGYTSHLSLLQYEDVKELSVSVLRRLCRNSDGLFWAGDTTQTISAGSSFRFNDLKAFVYRMERHSGSVASTGAPVHQPMMFQLATNYRSHNGIVNCAHSVIELITKFWPNAIDHLQPEKGMVDGVKPKFFTDVDNDAHCKRFLVGESASNLELGAHQCILVRNEAAVKKLRDKVGDIGIIMTLYDSKGLEFDDVLLYNFFGDSAIDASRWRVVLNGVQGQGYVPDFYRDETRYTGICSELKLLYVGITRARKNVWIFDTSDKSDAMRIFWESQNLIDTCARGTDVPPLADPSTPEEWASSGRSLFSHKRYLQAIHCFKHADRCREVKVCEAYLLREAARSSVGVALLNIQQRAFTAAADAFADCGAAAVGNERRQYYRTSADCYVRGGQDLKAADTYLKAEEFELAAKRYRKAGSFDKTLYVLTDQRAVIPEKTATDLWMVCRLHYCGRSDDQAPVPLFSSSSEELEFLEEYDLDCARISLLESQSKYYEVAEIYLSDNRPMEAVQAFLNDNRNIDSAARAADTLLEFMWRKCSFRITPKAAVADDSVRQAIALADQLQMKKLKPMTRNLVLMFQSILREDHESLKKLALTFQERGHYTAALHCLDHFFTRSTDIRPFQLHEMASFLETFHTYARLLYQTSTLHDPLGRRECDVQRLFSIVPLSGDEFLIPSGTFLHDSVTTTQNNHLVLMHQSGYKASRRNATELISLSIRTVLQDKVLALDEMCCGAPVFLQCLPYIVYGNCRRKGCPQEHVTMSDLNRAQYNAHVAIHMQLILILQLLYSAHPSMMRWKSMRNWLEHLYEALTPPLFIQGSFADLDLTLIPHGLAGLRVVRNWIREAFYRMNPSTSPQFLTTLMRIASLSFTFDRNDAPAYIAKAQCLTRNRSVELLRKPDNRYLVMDILNSYRGATPSSISSGILFLQYVLNNRLRVNLSVLCDCIEDILSSFVINHRMDPTLDELPLHGVVLPSNWLISPYKFSVKKDVEPQSIGSLLDTIGNLIKKLRVVGATDFMWLAHVTNATPLLRNIFIFRLTLCLVAHNTRYPMVKRKVNSIMLHLHKTKRPQHPAYYRKLVDDVVEYMALLTDRRMPRLDGYLRAVLDFDTNNAPSDLVKLVHKTRQSTQISSVRQVLYERASEIPYLLSSRMVAAQSTLRPEAATFVPRMQHLKDDVEIRQVKKENLEPMPQEAEEKDVPVVVDPEATDGMEDIDETVTPLTSLDPVPDESLRSNGPSEEQNWAALMIQHAYRFHVWRRSGSAVDAEIDAIFRTCLKETRSSEWRPSLYRLLFLGPLPHLLACLEQGIALTHAAKAKTKDLSKVSHEKLEELGRQRSEITSLLKKGLQLRNKLEPSSPDHRTRDIDALKRAVSEVGEFIQKVPGSTKDMRTNFQMAYKGIIAEKKLFRVLNEKPEDGLKDDAEDPLTSLGPVPDESLHSNWPSEEQDWAARRIQYAYRFHVWRRSGSAVNAEIDAIFRACLKETRSSEWRPSLYRLLFLGPLPHLLTCLEQGITLTHAAKTKPKDLNKMSHEKLEELGRQRSKITSLLKKGLQLRNKLEPSAPDHRTRDIDALRRAVLEVGEFIQKVPGSTKDMRTNFQMAYKGIVAEKKLFRVLNEKPEDGPKDDAENPLTSLDPVPDESFHSNGPSEEQDWAARRIQYAYRLHVWRCSGSAVNAEIDAIFRTCLKETRSSEWRPSYYRLLFLGPLPHLLACLQQGITLTHAAKAKTKDLSNHEQLEELGRQRSELTSLLKKGMQLRNKLEPCSADHRTRDIDALKRAVLEVGEFIQKAPGSTKDMHTNFQMAYKGIVAKKKLFRVQKKPALNVEDL